MSKQAKKNTKIKGAASSIFANSKLQAIILFAVAMMLFAALATYSSSDPSFNVAHDYAPGNILSYAGSYLADFLYQFLGLSVLILPLAFACWSFCLFKKESIGGRPIVSIFTLIASMILISALLNIYSIGDEWGHNGGIIGSGFVHILNHYTNSLPYSEYTNMVMMAVTALFVHVTLNIPFRIYWVAIKAFFRSILLIWRKLGIVERVISFDNRKAFYETEGDIDQQSQENIAPAASSPKARGKPSPHMAVKPSALSNNILPSVNLLQNDDQRSFARQTPQELEERSQKLLDVLADFRVKGNIIDVKEGPVVTMYEFEPAAGTKSSRVIGLADDIARSLSAVSARIAVIPGRNALGIELPNKNRMFFRLKELLENGNFRDPKIQLPIILGKDLSGQPMIADLAKMPHLLVAGTTGSGKSVAINAMIMSLLYRYDPSECKMIMIDPKMLELSAYDNIPHLMTPVVTEPSKAVTALKWAVKEMENRYRLMSNLGVRNISNYNARILEAIKNKTELSRKIQTGFNPQTGEPIFENIPIEKKKMPFIVVIVDEMADLMLVAGKDIETSIQRLAQMARAAGIHIIMATQRPSVDVITGVIKANFPSRISFKVTSKIDSRTILGEQGAEQLLGMGDMLYMGSSSRILRVHGPFVDDCEVEKVTSFLKTTGMPEYISAITESSDDEADLAESESSGDDLYDQALAIVKRDRKCSISYIQRCLRIGYNKSATIVEKMEQNGVLSAPNHSGKREILLPTADDV